MRWHSPTERSTISGYSRIPVPMSRQKRCWRRMPENDLSLRAKMKDCLCSNESAKGFDGFSCSFFAFPDILLPPAQPMALPAIGKEIRMPHKSVCHIPLLRGLRGFRTDNFGGQWQRPHLSQSPTPRRSGNVRATSPSIPAGGIM